MVENVDKKSRNNAAIAYLMIFFSWLLFFNKKNVYINNTFVKSHIKSSIILHVLLLLNYVVFIWYGFLWKISIFGIGLNILLADSFFILIGIFLVKGIYSAINGSTGNLGEAIKSSTTIGLDINNDNVVDEKDKLTIILANVSFVGYIVCSKYKNINIQNIIKFNLFVTLFIFLVYIFRHDNIANLFLLLYLIYIAFSGVSLYGKDELIIIKLPEYLSPSGFLLFLKTFTLYLYNYFKGSFKEFKLIKEEIILKENAKNIEETGKLEKLEATKMNKNLIYVPFINFIFFFEKDNKYLYHIKNGITLSFILIISIILVLFGFFSSRTLLLFIFPICFGIGMLGTLHYKMPFVYLIYESFIKIKDFFFSSTKKINEKRKEVNEVNLKVK